MTAHDDQPAVLQTTFDLQQAQFVQPYVASRKTTFDLSQPQFMQPYVEPSPRGSTVSTHDQQVASRTQQWVAPSSGNK